MKEFRKIKSLKFLYEISNDGVVRNTKSKHILTPRDNMHGYLQITCTINGKLVYPKIHRLVAECWLDNKPDNWKELTVNHKDFNRKNNYYKNLEFMTLEDNIKYSNANGRKPEHHKGRKIFCKEFDMIFDSGIEAAEFIKNKFGNEGRIETISRNIRNACSKKSFAYHSKWSFI